VGANTYSVTGGNFIVSPGTTASYSVTGTSTAGCVSAYAVSQVTVHTTPSITVNSGSICAGENFVIIPSGADAFTISGGSYTVSPAGTTSYTLSGASVSGCISAPAISSVQVDVCTDIKEKLELTGWLNSLYPNPNSGILNIESNQAAIVKVIDPSGRVVYESEILSGTTKLSLEHLNQGLYFMELTQAHGKQVFRIIRQ
jgi:hypothetical protein